MSPQSSPSAPFSRPSSGRSITWRMRRQATAAWGTMTMANAAFSTPLIIYATYWIMASTSPPVTAEAPETIR